MIKISLDFMPAFYVRHLGLKWGENYYFDPEYRAVVELARERLLYEIFGAYGVGSQVPVPSATLFIQPVDLFMRTQGAEWRFPADATVESWGQPWKGLAPADIDRIDPRQAAAHPVVAAIIRQYDKLRKLYGERADVLGLRSGLLNIHGPYTTAHQLMGDDLFMLMMDDPAGARRVFAKVWDIYKAMLGRIATAAEAPWPLRVNIGDCAASMISADLYRQCVLPADNAIAAEFETCVYHSCGPSTHLLNEFSRIRKTEAIQLGPGTDLTEANELLSGNILFQPLIDPVLMRDGGTEEVHDKTREMAQLLQRRGAGTLCAWSFDAATPLANVHTLYDAVASSSFSMKA